MRLPDWHRVGTIEELESNIGNGFKFHLGWIETKTDTILCTEHSSQSGVRALYMVQCWNEMGVRAGLGVLLGLPVYKEW